MVGYFPVNPQTKSPLQKEWQKCQSKNIDENWEAFGINLDDNILVVDVDPRNNGDKSEAAMLEKGLLIDTKIVTTASGGRHYYYKKPQDIKIKKTCSDFPGIDFLSRGCYVIAPGSVINGVSYTSTKKKLETVPIKLLEIIEKKTSITVDKELESSEKLSVLEITKLLTYLKDDHWINRKNWLDVGMAIHNETNGSKEGFEAWHSWSIGRRGYKNEYDCAKDWNSFKVGGGITIGTLIHHAKEHGYGGLTAPEELTPLEGYEQKTNLHLEIYDWIYVNDLGKFYNYKQPRELYDKEKIQNYFALAYPKENVVKIMLRSRDIYRVDNLVYRPGCDQFIDENGLKFYNTWRPNTVEPVPGDASIFEDHLKWLLEDDWIHCRNWMAYLLQKPADRIRYALIITGEPGVGKSFIGEALASLVSYQYGNNDINVSRPSNEAIHEKYSDWVDKQLVIVNELMARGRRDLMNKLKQIITEDIIPDRRMNRAEGNMRAVSSLLFFSNYHTPIVLDEYDRRFCILRCYKLKREKEYYKKIFDWKKNNLGVLKHYLLNVDLTNFDPHTPPDTLAKQHVIDESNDKHGVGHAVRGWIYGLPNKVFTLTQLRNFVDQNETETYIDNRHLAHLASNFATKLKRMKINNREEKVYCANEVVHIYKNFNNADLKKRLKEHDDD